MKTSKRKLRKSEWRRFSGKHNACLRLNRQGQLEILAHIGTKADIRELCRELLGALETEWELRFSMEHLPEHSKIDVGLFGMEREPTSPDLSAVPELRPLSAETSYIKRPA